MKQLAIVGRQLIHTYPYVVNFNGADRDLLRQHAKAWMWDCLKDRDLSPLTDAMRVTRIWSPDSELVAGLAETCGIDRICSSVDEAIDGADGVMVMDEDMTSRLDIIERCVRQPVTVFADKIISLDVGKTEEVLALAESNGVEVRSWSQLYFAGGLDEIRSMAPGGVGLLPFRLEMQMLAEYSIHPLCTLQSAFNSRIIACRPLSDDQERVMMLELADGTRVLLTLGPTAPAGAPLCYVNQDCFAAADTSYKGEMFAEGSAAMIDLFQGNPRPGPSTTEMIEACRMVECIVRGGTDGERGPPGP